jgi:hypothetical protein
MSGNRSRTELGALLSGRNATSLTDMTHCPHAAGRTSRMSAADGANPYSGSASIVTN